MATKIDKARRFANDFILTHDIELSEHGVELFAQALLEFEKSVEKSVSQNNLTPAKLVCKCLELE